MPEPTDDHEINTNLTKHEIEMSAGQLELYHGTVQPAGETIQKWRLGRATPMPTSKSAQYNTPGEAIPVLSEIDAIWMSTEPDGAEAYMTPRWGATLGDEEQGQLYETEISADRIAYVPYTEEASIRAALAAKPQAIYLEDRKEVMVLDPSLISVTRVTDNEGQDIEMSPAPGEAKDATDVGLNTSDLTENAANNTPDENAEKTSAQLLADAIADLKYKEALDKAADAGERDRRRKNVDYVRRLPEKPARAPSPGRGGGRGMKGMGR